MSDDLTKDGREEDGRNDAGGSAGGSAGNGSAPVGGFRPLDLDAWLVSEGVDPDAEPARANERKPSRPGNVSGGDSAPKNPLPPLFTPDEIAAGLSDRQILMTRALNYVSAMPPSISGQLGHHRMFDVAFAVIQGFDLSFAEARPVLDRYNAERCQPAWSSAELYHKMEEADGKADSQGRARGYLIREEETGDANALAAKAEEIVKSGKVENLYLDEAFRDGLAQLERVNTTQAEVIKQRLRELPGYRERVMDRLMAKSRMKWKIKDAPPVGGADDQDSPGEDGVAHQDGRRRSYPLTDMGNGKRLMAKFGQRIKYVKAYGDWIIHNGRRWKEDDFLEIEKMAQKIPAEILTEIPPTQNAEIIQTYRNWSDMSQSRERLAATIHAARSHATVIPDQLDRDPWLLNCANGTFNLKTGQIQPHNPADLITKVVKANYDPEAKCPVWDEFVLSIMNDNPEMAAFLKRAVGYSITGVIREQVFFFLYGEGANGKTTFLNTITSILNDYSNQISSDLLISHDNEQHPTGLTDLEGRRFIAADESEENKSLAESQVKMMTGDSVIKARRMRENFYEFHPTHKIFFASNHQPEIRGTDAAIWRRVKPIPFLVSFDPTIPGSRKPDYALKDKLARERSGILNWMIQGCREWQIHGIGEPKSVRDAVADYRKDMDLMGWFVSERMVEKADHHMPVKVMYAEYQAWAESNNVRAVGPRKFSSQLSDKGYPSVKSNSITFKVGLRFKEEAERRKEEEEAARMFQTSPKRGTDEETGWVYNTEDGPPPANDELDEEGIPF